jgi:hypothetical protein
MNLFSLLQKSYPGKSARRVAEQPSSSSTLLAALGQACDLQAEQVVAELAKALPDLAMAAVVFTASGAVQASLPTHAAFDIARVSIYNAKVIRQQQQWITAMQLQAEQIQDIVFVLRDQVHVLRMSPSGRRFVYVAMNQSVANVVLMRDLISLFAAQLDD